MTPALKSSFNLKEAKNREENSVVKVLDTQAGRPKFKPLNPYKKAKHYHLSQLEFLLL